MKVRREFASDNNAGVHPDIMKAMQETTVGHTIAYGDDADMDLLQTLANRTNGKQFSGDVADIEAVYFLISSEF